MSQDSRIVGKHTLESLTVGMYADNRIIFREYIQNATDAIDKAIHAQMIAPEEGRIDIEIDSERREVRIRDNGTGIQAGEVYHALGDIGHSSKTYAEDRGFRGIGRLGGLGYCTELQFITSYQGESKKTTTSWDARRLRELLQPNNEEFETVIEVVDAVTQQEEQSEQKDLHYFEVVLSGISTGHDNLLDFDDIRNYLSQVAPVPFDYKLGAVLQEINKKLQEYEIMPEEYHVCLHDHEGNSEQIYKPYRRDFPAGQEKHEFIEDISFFEGKRENNKLFFLGWYGKTALSGMVKDDTINGLRVRKRNILIGNNRSLDEFFGNNPSYQRFNRWFIGEIYVFDDNLIPNARRDDFEKNSIYFAFKREVKKTTDQLARQPHKYSRVRSTEKKLKEVPQDIHKIDEELSSPAGITETRKEQLFEEFEKVRKKVDQIDPDAYMKITPPTTPSTTNTSLKDKTDEIQQTKKKFIEQINELDNTLSSSTNYPAQNLPSSISRGCRKHISTIFDVIDRVLDEGLAKELKGEIIKALQPQPKKEKRS